MKLSLHGFWVPLNGCPWVEEVTWNDIPLGYMGNIFLGYLPFLNTMVLTGTQEAICVYYLICNHWPF